MNCTKEEIAIAALLHDIGKFMQRAEVPFEGYDYERCQDLFCPFNKVFNDFTHKHAAWTDYFFEKAPLNLPSMLQKSIVQRISASHHKPESEEAELIQKADWYSSGMERIDIDQDFSESRDAYKRKRLNSVFQLLEIKYRNPDPGKLENNWYTEMNPLDMKKSCIFPINAATENPNLKLDPPVDDLLVPRYKQLWNGVSGEYHGFVNEIKDIKTDCFNIFFCNIYYLLQKYTWSIPSATNVFPDISLFDHLRTTSAIASCLYDIEVSKEKPADEFLLLGGDISGIQSYIYRIARAEGTGGISKRLRGRSFYLCLLPQMLSYYIIDNLKHTIANLLYCGGGKFEILLPNILQVTDKIDEIKKSISTWMLGEFSGELGFIIDYVTFSYKSLQKDYGKVRLNLDEKLGRAKRKKFSDLFYDDDFWVNTREQKGEHLHYCKSCLTKTVDREEILCECCNLQKELGEKIGNAEYLVFTLDQDSAHHGLRIPFGQFGNVSVLDSAKFISDYQRDAYAIFRINDLNDDSCKSFQLIGNVLPRASKALTLDSEKDEDNPEGIVREGQVLTFESIADMSIGDKRIGILKMDVDNLGLLFSLGFEETGTRSSITSISRISTLSRSLDYFFAGYINKICNDTFVEWQQNPENKWENRNNIDNIFYLSYSGGDDLLIIGPWSEIPLLASNIEREFTRFTTKNPNVTLSGGIFFCKPKYPISRGAHYADEELEKSKTGGRDRITLFGLTNPWHERELDLNGKCISLHREADKQVIFNDELIKFSDDIYEWLKDNKIPRGFLHTLLSLRKQYWDDDKGCFQLNYIPLIIYNLERRIYDSSVKAYLRARLVSDVRALRYLNNLPLSLGRALLKTRR
jgi:CRISPR-associated protein Csm1